MRHTRALQVSLLSLSFFASAAFAADSVLYNNDFPDGKVATASGSPKEAESADDFILGKASTITSGSFTGLIPKTASILSVGVEIYGACTPGSGFAGCTNLGKAVTRVNSPTSEGLPGTERTTGDGTLNYSTSLLNNGIGVVGSVVDGINAQTPNVPATLTGGDGPASGKEVRVNFDLTQGITLPAGHYFFVPSVELNDGSFLQLSAYRTVGGEFGSTLITPDLQAWVRNNDIKNDWLRTGTDIIGGPTDPATYNLAFRLVGTVVPEPTGVAMLIAGLVAVGAWSQRKRA